MGRRVKTWPIVGERRNGKERRKDRRRVVVVNPNLIEKRRPPAPHGTP